MRIKYAKVLTPVLVLANAAPVLGESDRGVQAIILSRWSEASVAKFTETASVSGPRRIYVSCMPFFQPETTYRVNGLVTVKGPFTNMEKVLEGVRSAGKRVTFVVYFSYHDGNSKFSKYRNFKRDGKLFRDFLEKTAEWDTRRRKIKELARFVLCPSLEDEYRNRDTFYSNLKALVGAIGIKGTTKRPLVSEIALLEDFAYLRCTASQHFLLPETEELTIEMEKQVRGVPKVGKVELQLKLQREIHTAQNSWVDIGRTRVFTGNYDYHSNDGCVVYNSESFSGLNEIIKGTANAASNLIDQQTVGEFVKGAYENINGVEMLWRPSYNLFQRTISNSVLTFQKYGDPEKRNDPVTVTINGSQSSTETFDQYESQVLADYWSRLGSGERPPQNFSEEVQNLVCDR